MSIIPKYLLFVCQLFGVFPVKLQKSTLKDHKLVFSPELGIWGISFVGVLVSGSYLSVAWDIVEGSKGRPVKMVNTKSLVSVVLDHLSLTSVAIMIVVSSVRQCTKLIAVYGQLKKFDIELKLDPPSTRITTKIVISFSHLFICAIWSYISIFNDTSFLSHFYLCNILLCFFHCAFVLHFNHLCGMFHIRIGIVNNRMRKEIITQGK